MRFRRRIEAGRSLATRLDIEGAFEGPCVVAGIPRGGVVVAAPIATRFQAPLFAIHARKLTAPHEPEVAFGALDADGHALIDHGTVVALGLGSADVDRIKKAVAAEIEERCRLYPARPLADELQGKTAVIVDDGLATGLTMAVAIAYARRHGASATIVAVPCAAADAARDVRALQRRKQDRFVCLDVDPAFRSVASYYMEFEEVSDLEVARLLEPAAPSQPTRFT
jgi:putative phosphoribosyl transferase